MSVGSPGPKNLIIDVDGILVGHAHDPAVGTGTSVVKPAARAVAACDVRGGGPGTRETDALNAENLVSDIDAVVLSGGSVYGLGAASAVTDWLGARGQGYAAAPGSVAPIVPSAILFDLVNGGDKTWGEQSPYPDLGRAACDALSADAFPLGNVGAGYGARAGSLKGGLGSASVVTADGLQVGALAAVNSYGSTIIPGTDRFWAWTEEIGDEFGGKGGPAATPRHDVWDETKAADKTSAAKPGTNTTIAVVATNAVLSPAQAKRVAMMAQDGLARAVNPIHTPMDGDSVFVIATGRAALPEPAPLSLGCLGALAASCLARAVARGVYYADDVFNIPSYRKRFG